ncbi:MAG: LOG family protein [Blastocatellia bacterium]|nr:LOG family protein [Blastocatellia bacterium]
MLSLQKDLAEPLVTVFGGSRCTAESIEYQEAMTLGRLLAEAGYAVCTGGYAGIMEAISRGAHEVNGHVVGVTMSQLKSVPNRFLKETWPTDNFYNRLQHLIQSSEAFFALRGGMGTITEISLVWNKLYTGVLAPRPLILVGDCWPPIIEAYCQNLAVGETDLKLITCVPDAQSALEAFQRWNWETK